MGATRLVIAAPLPDLCFDIIEREDITSSSPADGLDFLAGHPGFDTHNLDSLCKGYYGASIMPVPVLEELRLRLPAVRLFNCYGQSEIAPLATVAVSGGSRISPASPAAQFSMSKPVW